MNQKELNVLIVEDNPRDRELMVAELRAHGFEPRWECVQREAEYVARLSPALDLILCDYILPDFDAIRALELLQASDLRVPVLVLTGALDDESAVKCLRHGAADYLLKDRPARLGAAAAHAIEQSRLRAVEEQAARFFDLGHDLLCIGGFDGYVRQVNPAWEDVLGFSGEYLRAAPFMELVHPDDRDAMATALEGLATGNNVVGFKCRARRRDGSYRWLEWNMRSDPRAGLFYAGGRDITDRLLMERELRASEERFRLLVEHGTDLISIVGADGITRYASPSHRRVLGYSPHTLVGTSAFDLVHPDDVARLATIAGGLETPGAECLETYRVRHRDGSWRELEGIGRNLLEAPGIEGLIICARDVTERRAAERVIAASARTNGALARVGTELISLVDRPRLLTRLCELTTELLGCDYTGTWLWDAGQQGFVPVTGHGGPSPRWETPRAVRVPAESPTVERLRCVDVVRVTADDGHDELLAGLLRARGMAGVICFALRHGAELAGFQVAGYAGGLPGASAELDHLPAGIGHLASMALANVRLVEKLAEASRLKTEFVSTMSHELRTPLNVIFGFAEMARDPGSTEEARLASLERIDRASRNLFSMIENTLLVSRLEASLEIPDLSPVVLADFWDALKLEWESLPPRPGVVLKWADVPQGTLITDRRKLWVALYQLVANALKFTEEGTVRVEAELAEDEARFRVTDTGVGIHPDEQELIFELFRQADGSETRHYGGTGLGLFVARQLARRLGGDVSVESALGRGSTFTLSLPRRGDGTYGAAVGASSAAGTPVA